MLSKAIHFVTIPVMDIFEIEVIFFFKNRSFTLKLIRIHNMCKKVTKKCIFITMTYNIAHNVNT